MRLVHWHLLLHMVQYWDVAHQLMSPRCRWQQPRETIPLKLWSRVRRLLVGKGRKGRKAVRGYWQLHAVSKSPFIMKYGVKLEVLTAEGPDRAAMQTSARKQKGREVELGEEGVGEDKHKAGKGRREV